MVSYCWYTHKKKNGPKKSVAKQSMALDGNVKNHVYRPIPQVPCELSTLPGLRGFLGVARTDKIPGCIAVVLVLALGALL